VHAATVNHGKSLAGRAFSWKRPNSTSNSRIFKR